MRHGVKGLISLLTALAAVSSFAAAPVSAVGSGIRPAAAAVEAAPTPGRSAKEVGVTVTPPKDITFGQIPEDPSAEQKDTGDGVDREAAFTYRYMWAWTGPITTAGRNPWARANTRWLPP